MIRFPISKEELEQRVEAHKPGWLARASDRTATLPEAPKSADFPSLWSEIKEVYIALQGSKCAYCEKWLENENIEHDVEHFRPKTKVSRWQPSPALVDAGVVIQQPDSGSEPGYRLLAYHPLNYATSCKTCNSILKADRFPIRGTRQSSATDPATLKEEEAYLIYPISDIDDDPETLIEFDGISPRPVAGSRAFGRLRALVTIEFFKLEDWRERKSLLLDRAELIEKLYWALERRTSGATAADVELGKQAAERMTSHKFRHANCLRSFRRLYESNRAKAVAMYDTIKEYLQSYS